MGAGSVKFMAPAPRRIVEIRAAARPYSRRERLRHSRGVDIVNGGTPMAGSLYLIALLFGIVAGLRTFTAPAVAAWTVHLGPLDLTASRMAFMGNAWVRWILTGLALFELVMDQLPTTPSRRVPAQFGGRLIAGALSGGAIGASADHALRGALVGLVGAILGTLGGSRARARLAGALHNDHPAGLIEDAVAIGGAVLLGIAAR